MAMEVKTDCGREYVTVVYEVVNDLDWGQSNPLRYSHNGLKAVGVSLGDLMERVENLERVCNENDIPLPEIIDA
jgi:hypothetical protein